MKRIVWIDVSRALAIFWVATYHYFLLTRDPLANLVYFTNFLVSATQLDILSFFSWGFSLIWRLGYEGVHIFIVLSGLGLTLAAYKKRTSSIPNFYKRAFVRLAPPYWLAFFLAFFGLIFLSFLRSAFLDGTIWSNFQNGFVSSYSPFSFEWTDILASLFLVPRVMTLEWLYTIPVSLWFIVLIFQFYLAFPFLFKILKKISWPKFLIATLILTLFSRFLFLTLTNYQPEPAVFLGVLFPFRLYEFSLGMVLAHLLIKKKNHPFWDKWYFGLISLLSVFCGSLLDGIAGVNLALPGVLITSGWLGIIIYMRKALEKLAQFLPSLPFLGQHSYTLLILQDSPPFFLKTALDLGVGKALLFFGFLIYLPLISALTIFWHKSIRQVDFFVLKIRVPREIQGRRG